MCVKVCVNCVSKCVCVHAPVCTYLCIYVCVYEAANHRLIGAIRELAVQHSIAAPDGQREVDTLHVDTCIQNTHTYFIQT